MSASGTAQSLPLPEACEGLVISEKYEIERALGTGSMGAVYQAQNLTIRRRVAIKILNPEFATRGEAIGRFQREAQAAAQIGHPHIIEVLDMGRTEAGLPFIVMELLDGEDLRTRLERECPMQPGAAVDIVLQVLAALGAAHAAGIVHRDLKPENVFLVKKGMRRDFVKVIDFGVAKYHDPGASNPGGTRDGAAIGTPWYMSPEQARGKRSVDARSDLYAVGVLLYEMLSGRLPHVGESSGDVMIAIATQDPWPLAEVAKWVSAELSDIVAKTMQRDPADRFQTAQELVNALEPFGEAVEFEISDVRDAKALAPLLPPVPEPVADIRRVDTLNVRVDRGTIDEQRGGGWKRWAAIGGLVALVGAVGVLFQRQIGAQTGPAPGAAPALRSSPLPAHPVLPEPEAATPPTLPAAAPVPEAATAPPAEPAPTPAPARPAAISLDVGSNVAGARVELDGDELGTTPLSVQIEPRRGAHVLRVEHDGYLPWTKRVRLDAPLRLEADLLRRGGPVRNGPRPPPQKTPGGRDGTFDPFSRR